MTEERKFAILIAATILSTRKLAELEDPDKLTPKKVGTVENSHSTRGLYSREIDKKWPTKAPASFTN